MNFFESLRGKLPFAKTENLKGDQKSVIETHDLSHYWYEEAFNTTEKEIFKSVISEKDSRFLELGIGKGRGIELFLVAVTEKFGEKALDVISSEVYGFDINEKLITDAQHNLGQFGIPERNIFSASFYSIPKDLKNIDLIWSLMNTTFYCKTEIELAQFLSGIDKMLSSGGRFLFDTVKTDFLNMRPTQEEIHKFEDLKNFYSVLALSYREKYLKGVQNIIRYPILDRPSKGDFCAREIITPEYINYIIDEYRLNLKQGDFYQSKKNSLNKQRSRELAREWIENNNLKDWLLEEIAFRLEKINCQEPLYSQENRQDITPQLITENPAVKEVYEELLVEIGKNYEKEYYLFQKV